MTGPKTGSRSHHPTFGKVCFLRGSYFQGVFSFTSMSLPGNARKPIVNSHSLESRRTPKSRNEFSIRESVFPVHSLIGPCSDWSRRLSFSSQSTVRHVVIPERLGLNMQYSLYFSLLAGNWGRRKVRTRLRPPPASPGFSLCSSSSAGTPDFAA